MSTPDKPFSKSTHQNASVVSPLFMMAQLPFNTQAAVPLNTPMIEVMNDEQNVKVATKNLKELGLWKDLCREECRFLEVGCGSGYLLEKLIKRRKRNLLWHRTHSE